MLKQCQMENPDPNQGAVSRVISILRRVTRWVQLAPFIYLVLYGLYMCFCAFIPEGIACLVDGIMTTSPILTTGLLFLSRVLKLCNWHKTACLLPPASQVETFVDSYLFTFTQNEIIFINTALGILSLAFIIRAHRHFFNGR